MDISVVVPTFNRRDLVFRTVATLLCQDFPSTDYEVIVVVDGSTDGTAAVLKSLKSPCRLHIIEQENRGPSAARNSGWGAARAPMVLFLDDDMLCDPGLVAAHVSAHKEHDGAVAFGALFLSADSPRSLAAECFNREIGAFYLKQKHNPETAWQVTNCVFSNTSLSRTLLAEYGGFDESFRKREDFELGFRLFAAGVRPLYVSNAIAYQYYDKTTPDLLLDAEAFALGDVQIARKHPGAQMQGRLIANEPRWKNAAGRLATNFLAIESCFLAPLCELGEKFIHVPALRNIGVRALQVRRRILWLRVVRRSTIPYR